jgi:hypothetical protein
MLVRCITNRIDAFAENSDLYKSLKNSYRLPDGIVHLTPAMEYVVYAISFDDMFPRFFVADDVFSSYPISYLAPFFEVVDERFSRYWGFLGAQKKWSEIESLPLAGKILSVKEWMQRGQRFYENLVDGGKKEEEIFYYYKELMDLEFVQPRFTDIGTHLQDNWVQCPVCGDAWEAAIEDEMLRCPNCAKVILSPL